MDNQSAARPDRFLWATLIEPPGQGCLSIFDKGVGMGFLVQERAEWAACEWDIYAVIKWRGDNERRRGRGHRHTLH